MYKALTLGMLVAALSGCNALTRPADYKSLFVDGRCLAIAETKNFKMENLSYLEEYAGYGNIHCKAALGKVYKEGEYGVAQDFTKARALFEESAIGGGFSSLFFKGSALSSYSLGKMAELGEGEPINYAKARELYRVAGLTGNVALGRLLEDGKGGPQDLPAALELYVSATYTFGDDAWKGLDRLRKKGVPLDKSQKYKINTVWVKGFIAERNRKLAVREIFNIVNLDDSTKKVTLVFVFKSDSGIPQITMQEGSGNVNLDRWIMKAASRITMNDSPPLTGHSGELRIHSPVLFAPLTTQKMPWICGAAPCED